MSQQLLIPPSGSQYELNRGDQHLTVVEVGGGIRTYRRGSREVLDGYRMDQRCSGGRGQPLIPWPNRLADGRYSFEGLDEQAPLTEAEAGNAIHGLTRWSSWALQELTDDALTVSHVLNPQPGWAWTIDLAIRYRLDDSGLEVTTTAVNRSATVCPFGLGFHPYFKAQSGLVDQLGVEIPASQRFQVDQRGIPTGKVEVAGSDLDFRRSRQVGVQVIDVAFTSLERDDQGLATVRIDQPDGQGPVMVELDRSFGYVMMFTGDTLSSGARQGLAIEPMTCPANMLVTGEALIRLEPGIAWESSWAIRTPAG